MFQRKMLHQRLLIGPKSHTVGIQCTTQAQLGVHAGEGAEGAAAVPDRKMPARSPPARRDTRCLSLSFIVPRWLGAKAPCWSRGVKHLVAPDLQQRSSQFIVYPTALSLLFACTGFRRCTSFWKKCTKIQPRTLGQIREDGLDCGVVHLCTLLWEANQCIKPLKEGLLWRWREGFLQISCLCYWTVVGAGYSQTASWSFGSKMEPFSRYLWYLYQNQTNIVNRNLPEPVEPYRVPQPHSTLSSLSVKKAIWHRQRPSLHLS